MDIEHIPTPFFVVDREQLRKNCNKIAKAAETAKVAVRPHLKTHKCVEAAREQLEALGKDGGVVVSTLLEAEFFFSTGFTDITYAVVLDPSKVERALALASRGKLRVMVDSLEAVDMLISEHRGDVPWSVWIAVDTGYHREGVDYDSDEVVAIAKKICESEKTTELFGLYSHSGHAYNREEGEEGARMIGGLEAERMSWLSRRLKEEGIDPQHVAVGSTPSTSTVKTYPPEITEIHPGNYVFYDRQQVASGSCSLDEVAVYVGCRVLAHYPKRGELIVDAGGTALHKDSAGIKGFGVVRGHDDVILDRISQEVGVLRCIGEGDPAKLAQDSDLFKRFPVGFLLKIIPNHSCMTACMFAAYQIIDGKDAKTIQEQWVPCRGW